MKDKVSKNIIFFHSSNHRLFIIFKSPTSQHLPNPTINSLPTLHYFISESRLKANSTRNQDAHTLNLIKEPIKCRDIQRTKTNIFQNSILKLPTHPNDNLLPLKVTPDLRHKD